MQTNVQILLGCGRASSLLSSNDRWDNTPLHTASAKGHLQALVALLEAGAQIDNKNEDEQTPLHIAAKHGKTRYSSISIFHISSCCVLFLSRLGSELHKFKITMKITV